VTFLGSGPPNGGCRGGPGRGEEGVADTKLPGGSGR